MTEERVYFNSEHLKDNQADKLAQISTIKYEIKQLVLKQVKIKIHCAHLIKDKKNYAGQFQYEYYNLTKDCDTFSESKTVWNNSEIKKSLQFVFSLTKEKIRIAQAELKNIKEEIKHKNRRIVLLNIKYLYFIWKIIKYLVYLYSKIFYLCV
jgi:hypothetical protein